MDPDMYIYLRERNQRRNFHNNHEIRRGEQSVHGRRIRPRKADKTHHLSGYKQSLWMGDVQSITKWTEKKELKN